MILCDPGVTQPSCTSWSFAEKLWVLIAKLRTLVTRLTPIIASFNKTLASEVRCVIIQHGVQGNIPSPSK